MKMAEETFYDESSAIFIAKKICNVMSVSEPEACWHGYGERRMAIMNEVHDIMSAMLSHNEGRIVMYRFFRQVRERTLFFPLNDL